MMVDMQNMPVFLTSSQDGYGKLRMSAGATNNNTSSGNDSNWENDISAFLMSNTEQVMEFPHSVPSDSPVKNEFNYYATSSPESFGSPDGSPYRSDSSQLSSPFDPSLFNNTPPQEVYSPPQMYTPPQTDMYTSSPPPQMYTPPQTDVYTSPQNDFSAPIDVDPSLFEACNLTNPLLLPEIEKILAATPSFQPTSSPIEILHHESGSKKRAREFDFNANVTLSRDQLLSMTSKEIEEYVSAIKTKRALTAAEEKDLKKQRRLVKNREYASQSRSRKKQYVDELEKQLEQARAETDAYRKQNHVLLEENKILKKQLGHIAETIKKSQHGGGLVPGAGMRGGYNHQPQAHPLPHPHPHHSPSLGSSTQGMLSQFTIGGGRHSMVNVKTASACVFAILFMVVTFSTFWDNEPLGVTLFPSQNGHTFRNRELLGLDLDNIVDVSSYSSIPSPFPSSSPPSHSHSAPPNFHKSDAVPSTSSSSSSSSSPSSSPSSSVFHSPSPFSSALCYPHVYDTSVNASAWCSQVLVS